MGGFAAPFDYHSPTRVVFGAGTLAHLGELARELGESRVLLVTDPGLEAAGHPQRASQSLSDAGLEVFLFDEVEQNPTARHVEAGVAFARPHNIDLIVSVGGGSSMDCAKGINFLLTNGGKMSDYQGFGKAKKPMLPSIGVPTTAGTGSEAQSYALIADEETHLKMACGDRKAAFQRCRLGPRSDCVATAPGHRHHRHRRPVPCPGIVRDNASAIPLAQMFAREAWKLFGENLDKLLQQPTDLEARRRHASRRFPRWHRHRELDARCLPRLCQSLDGPLSGSRTAWRSASSCRTSFASTRPQPARLYADLAEEANLVDGGARPAEAIAQRVIRLMRTAELPLTLSECGVSAAACRFWPKKRISNGRHGSTRGQWRSRNCWGCTRRLCRRL